MSITLLTRSRLNDKIIINANTVAPVILNNNLIITGEVVKVQEPYHDNVDMGNKSGGFFTNISIGLEVYRNPLASSVTGYVYIKTLFHLLCIRGTH